MKHIRRQQKMSFLQRDDGTIVADGQSCAQKLYDVALAHGLTIHSRRLLVHRTDNGRDVPLELRVVRAAPVELLTACTAKELIVLDGDPWRDLGEDLFFGDGREQPVAHQAPSEWVNQRLLS
jgi:hypothetical protein